MKRVNIEEVLVGALVGGAFYRILGYYAIATIPLCAFFWSYGGMEGTSLLWRRIGVPITLLLGFLLSVWYKPAILPLIICSGACFGTTTLGYGVPDYQDDGSVLGRFIYKLVRGNKILTDILVRGLIGLLLGLSWIYLLKIYPFDWLIGVLVLMIGFPILVIFA